MSEMPLERLQATFGSALLGLTAPPSGLFTSTQALTEARFALYRGNLAAHWQRALAEAYPVLLQQVGEEFFHALAREYGRARPSLSGDLAQLGAGLADFLKDFPPVQTYPWFPALAQLEWAVHQASRAADGHPLVAAELAGLEAHALGELAVVRRPATALITSDWAVADLWLAHQAHGPQPHTPMDIHQPNRALIHRPHWRVEIRLLTLGEYTALEQLASCHPLAGALEAGVDADPAFDPGTAVARWLTDRLLETSP